MGIDVAKMEVPTEYGATPKYDPEAIQKRMDKPRSFKPKFKKRTS
jgi:hypothetical protein